MRKIEKSFPIHCLNKYLAKVHFILQSAKFYTKFHTKIHNTAA